MNKVRQPFNVNSLAQMAAIAALGDEKHITRVKKINEREKKYLYKQFKAMKINYIHTEANFIYFILEDDNAFQLYNNLLKKGVIVRPMGAREIRVSIGLPQENKKLIGAMKEIQKSKIKNQN